MNEREPLDLSGDHLSERMGRAVAGLRAPDVASSAMARGRRLRVRRRTGHVAAAVAAVTVVVAGVQAFAGSAPDGQEGPSAPPVAVDPTTTDPTTGAEQRTRAPEDDPCGDTATGWWSRSSAEIRSGLSTLLPAGVGIGTTDDDWRGTWGGNLTADGDDDFASLTLLPPAGVRGGSIRLEDATEEGNCFGGSNEPMQPVLPCDEQTGHQTCEEVRAGDGTLVGVVTERVELTVEEGQEEPTDKSYVLATVAVRGGGHVELYVAEGTRADRPGTTHDPADEPALTADQARQVVTDPVWTR